jgi:cyclase
VRKASVQFGLKKIIVTIDARRNKKMSSGFELVVSGGTKPLEKDAIA